MLGLNRKFFRIICIIGIALAALLLVAGVAPQAAQAQGGEPTPLRVEAAVTGQLTADSPTAVYDFFAIESLRMGVVFDVIEGDMQPTLLVMDEAQNLLAGSSGPNNNGLIVTFPAQGRYLLSLTADAGTSATYRLMIDADPPLPTNAFLAQTYVVSGVSTSCAENTPAAFLTPTEDLNVCFVPALLEGPTEFTAQWWSPSGEIVTEETGTLDTAHNFVPLLTGIVYQQGGTPWEEGWWQVHFLLNGELSHIQWLWVSGQ